MSIFKTKAIIIKISKISKNNFIYTLMSYDFWKIRVNKKKYTKERNLDLWYIINTEIQTNEKTDISKIRNIKIISEFNYQNKWFSIINWFLDLIATINKYLPDNLVAYEVYNTLETSINYKNINYNKLLLTKLKILNNLWLLKIKHQNNTIQKILKFINNNNIKNILKLTWIDKDIENELELICKNLIHY